MAMKYLRSLADNDNNIIITHSMLSNANPLSYQKAIYEECKRLCNDEAEEPTMAQKYESVSKQLLEFPSLTPTRDKYETRSDALWRFTQYRHISDIQVVIVGDDPGYSMNSCGIAFSYPDVLVERESLYITEHIFKELEKWPELGFTRPETYDLSPWCRRGVLLMNVALSKPENGFHHAWESVTRALVQYIALRNENVVFMLWGWGKAFFRGIVEAIKTADKEHLVLEAPHPHQRRGRYIFCDHFAQATQFQAIKKIPVTDWKL